MAVACGDLAIDTQDWAPWRRSGRAENPVMASFPTRDVQVVRELARSAVELAASEEYEFRRKRWRDVNGKRKPDRAPVWCRPAGAWRELIPPGSLACSDPFCRRAEQTLRQHLYKHWVGDDHIFEPWWGVAAVWERDTDHTWGLPTGRQTMSTDEGGFRYEHPVGTVEDYDRITLPAFTHNREKTQRAMEQAAELLGDAMPVRMVCQPPLGPHQGTYLEQLRGMEPMLHDLAFHPRAVHRVMAKLSEGILRALRVAEDSGLLTTNHHEPMCCSDPLEGEGGDGAVGLRHLWCAANSQEFQMVSPRMQEEFLLHYQIPVLQQFGAVQYGCCEDLSQKIGIVLKIPNLRVFVSSYWTDLEKVIEACGATHTIMWRQPAALVAHAHDIEPIKRHLEDGMRRLRGGHYQVVLRELETLRGHPERLREWARTAIAVAETFA